MNTVFGGAKNQINNLLTSKKQEEVYSDDFEFCQDFNGKNIMITGATGAVGSKLTEILVSSGVCYPAKVGLFLRNDSLLDTNLQ